MIQKIQRYYNMFINSSQFLFGQYVTHRTI